jgi:hypothetical protein
MRDSTGAVIWLVALAALLLLAPIGIRIYQTWANWMTAALVISISVAIITGAIGTACLIGLQTWRFAVRGQMLVRPGTPVVIDAEAQTVDTEYKRWRVEDVKGRALQRQHEIKTAQTPFMPAPGWAGQYADTTAGGVGDEATYGRGARVTKLRLLYLCQSRLRRGVLPHVSHVLVIHAGAGCADPSRASTLDSKEPQ